MEKWHYNYIFFITKLREKCARFVKIYNHYDKKGEKLNNMIFPQKLRISLEMLFFPLPITIKVDSK